MLMSFIGSIGTLVTNSGLAKVLESTFSGVAKLWNGKKFPQNVVSTAFGYGRTSKERRYLRYKI